MMRKISILLHGPLTDSAYEQIFRRISQLEEEILNRISIVVVSYVSDYKKTIEIINKLNNKKIKVDFVQIKDLVNPGFFNINRQIVSVRAGLSKIPENNLVIKLRNDQYVNFKRLIKVLENCDNLYSIDNPKILTTNCFTRKDRLYHPSDMFLCAMQPVLLQYYSQELSEKTHDGAILQMKQDMICGKKFNEVLRSPEIELCRSYLRLKNWNFKETEDDSFEAIKKYFFVVNTWDIDLRWNKKRTPLKSKGALIYPQYFDASPFEGAPVEHVSCYNRHDINGKIHLKDILLILESRVLWKFWSGNDRVINIKWFIKHCVRMSVIILVNIVPFFIGKRLAHIAYAPSLKHEVKLLIKKTFIFKIYKNIKNNRIEIVK